LLKLVYERAGSFEKLSQVCPINMVLGKKEDNGFVHLPEIDVSVQGQDANSINFSATKVMLIWRPRQAHYQEGGMIMKDGIHEPRPAFSTKHDAQTVVRIICTLILESRSELLVARILTIGIRRDDEKDKFVELIKKRGLDPKIYMESWEEAQALFHILFPEWRLYPYGFFTESDGAIVIHDRNYCPIVRFKFGEQPEIVHPLEQIRHRRIRGQRWFYESATSPILNPLCDAFAAVDDQCVTGHEGGTVRGEKQD
jgi:hypothetical protein